jgi:dephospho-CoA kinase
MLKLKKVAVTGGLSCGKSLVCCIFKEIGATVVSADEIVHQLLSPKEPIGQRVIELLGSDIVVSEQIDRFKIAEKVFDRPVLLHSLEQILHPEVKHEIERKYQQAALDEKSTLFVAEIPLLFESEPEQLDATIAVISDINLCKKRFKESTGYDEREFEKRMARQLSPEEKARRATFVISNNGSKEDLRQAVIAIYSTLTYNLGV